MQEKTESMKDYVARKLNETKFNVSAIARELDLNVGTLHAIRSKRTEEPGSTIIEILHAYFKHCGE